MSFVIPNLCHDMHDCSIAVGDAWLRAQLGGYAAWAMRHHSLLIVTWDEDDWARAIEAVVTGIAAVDPNACSPQQSAD